jgi:saccharopine dehydrogenase (NAD+, L-lysine-forming)
MIGAALMVRGDWQGDGVFNIEQMDPDPFMGMLNAHGLPWTVEEMAGPVDF